MSFVAIENTHPEELESCSGALLAEPLNRNQDKRIHQVNSNSIMLPNLPQVQDKKSLSAS
jgi:hypothetical protein